MRSTTKLLISAALLLPLPLAASPQAKDISGTWSGYIGRSEATPSAATLAVKQTSEGKLVGTLTGAKIMPGDIKSGTFDPATGALKLTILVRPTSDDKGGEVFFDGKVYNDSVYGTMLLAGEKGVFKFARQDRDVVDVRSVVSQDPGTAAAKRGFVEVSGWITRAAEMVPAEKYSYKPTSSVRTFGELVAHIVDGAKYYCGNGAGKKTEWTDATEKGAMAKPALLAALKKAVADCAPAYDAGKQIGPLMENVGHSSLHYGNMVTYIRMMGLTPPSSG
jgi:uncharacterized damage-inducible protein DinB